MTMTNETFLIEVINSVSNLANKLRSLILNPNENYLEIRAILSTQQNLSKLFSMSTIASKDELLFLAQIIEPNHIDELVSLKTLIVRYAKQLGNSEQKLDSGSTGTSAQNLNSIASGNSEQKLDSGSNYIRSKYNE